MAAQTVRGRVLDPGTGLPIEGVLVLLLDEAGVEEGGSFSNDSGWFLLRAPVPGLYSIRAERIGLESANSETLNLVVGVEHGLTLYLAQKAIELEGLSVRGEKQCVVRPSEGLILAQIWEEARKALFFQEWAEKEELHRFLVESYEKELDPETRWTVRENRGVSEWTTGNPIRSLPVEELLEDGFIRQDEGGSFIFHGPDATVLLSDEFLDTHCFGLEERDRNPGLIGLSFKPVGVRSVPDIFGTLWLDRTTFRLQFLEFGYTTSPWPEAIGVSEGRVHFESLADGSWIVRRWWIRMPKMVRSLSMMSGGRSGLRVGGIVEAGGAVTTISAPPSREAPEVIEGGLLRGLVWDSARAAPLAGAVVYLSGTQHSSTTDSAGLFQIKDVPGGFYRASFSHPRLDSVGVYPPGVEIHIPSGLETEINLATPSRIRTVEALCQEVGVNEETSAVVGTVRNSTTGDPVPGAAVFLEWHNWRVDGGRELRANVQTIEVPTDRRGRYRACIRWGAIVKVRAVLSGEMGADKEVQLPKNGVAVLDLTIGSSLLPSARLPAQQTSCPPPDSPAGVGTIFGRVVDAETQTPLGFTQIRVRVGSLDAPLEIRADASGAFQLCNVPAGEFTLTGQLAQLGVFIGPRELRPGENLPLNLELSPASNGQFTGTLTGVVIDRETGGEVEGATVTLTNLGQTGITNPHGRFAFPSLPPGDAVIVVDRMGYSEATGKVEIQIGKSVNTEVSLSSEPIALAPIEVIAVRRRLELPGLEDFERRLNSGWGQFILEDDIRMRSPIRLTQLFADKGVTVIGDGKGIKMRRTGCAPLVYVDDVKMTHMSRGNGPPEPRGGVSPQYLWPDPDGSPEGEAAVAVNDVLPSHVLAVEIYRGPAEIPGQYLDSNAMCGVILIWTRRGNLPGR